MSYSYNDDLYLVLDVNDDGLIILTDEAVGALGSVSRMQTNEKRSSVFNKTEKE